MTRKKLVTRSERPDKSTTFHIRASCAAQAYRGERGGASGPAVSGADQARGMAYSVSYAIAFCFIVSASLRGCGLRWVCLQRCGI
jgi:hypothetical protein